MTQPQGEDAVKLSELLERVERAGGLDRELDADIWWVLSHADAERCFNNGATGMPRHYPPMLPIPSGIGRAGVRAMAPAFSASLDAALALVERVLPGWGGTITLGDPTRSKDLGQPCVILQPHMRNDVGWALGSRARFPANAATPALALLAALLRALLSQSPAQHKETGA